MFIILKSMDDEIAYRIFTLVHLPLYFGAVLVMVQGSCSNRKCMSIISRVYFRNSLQKRVSIKER